MVTDDDALAARPCACCAPTASTDDYAHDRGHGRTRGSRRSKPRRCGVGLRALAAENARRREIARPRTAPRRPTCGGRRRTRGTCTTCAWPGSATGALAFRAGCRSRPRVHYPRALTQQPAYREFVRDAVPRSRGVGGGVRIVAVLPRDDRRRDRGSVSRDSSESGGRVRSRRSSLVTTTRRRSRRWSSLAVATLDRVGADGEVIVIDDGSTDGSPHVLKELTRRAPAAARRHPRAQPRLRRRAAVGVRVGRRSSGSSTPTATAQFDPAELELLVRRRVGRRRRRAGLQAPPRRRRRSAA